MSSSKPRQVPPPNDGAAKNPYARFIPREELNSFAAWSPGDLAGGPPPQTNVQRGTNEDPVRVDVAAKHVAELRAARQSGYQDGYRDGLVALDGFKQSFAAQTTAQFGTLLQALDAGLDGLQQDMARTLATTAANLARQVVRGELGTRPELVAQVAQEALDALLLSARHITLRVHPADHAMVAQGCAEVLVARGARLLADASVARGGCFVESDVGVIDASIDARWRRAVAALGIDEGFATETLAAASIDEGDDA
jgi:flagellar assembly protein FliH